MDNIADVIKGLELCTKVFYGATGICDLCPYFKHEGLCVQQLNKDALEHLKSQQAEIKRLTKPADGTWIQKADETGHEYSMCSACETVINTPDGCGGYYKLDMTGAKYCPNCGAKMD